MNKKDVKKAIEKVSTYLEGFEDYEHRIIECERLSVMSFLTWLLTEVEE